MDAMWFIRVYQELETRGAAVQLVRYLRRHPVEYRYLDKDLIDDVERHACWGNYRNEPVEYEFPPIDS